MKRIFRWSFVVLLCTGTVCIVGGWIFYGLALTLLSGAAAVIASYWKLMEQTLRLLVDTSPFDFPRSERLEWFLKTQPKANDVQEYYAPHFNGVRAELDRYLFVCQVLRTFGLEVVRVEFKPATLQLVERKQRARLNI